MTREPRDIHYPIHDVIASRWSPYGFADRDVPLDDLRAVFEAARWAPSSMNEQPWRFIVATRDDRALFDRVLSCLVEGNQVWARNVPVLVLTVASATFARNDKPNRTAWHDLGLAAATLTVEATARGLSVHQMGGITPERAREEFDIPDGFDAVTAIAIGYHDPDADLDEKILQRDAKLRPRRPLTETVFGGTWGTAASWLTS